MAELLVHAVYFTNSRIHTFYEELNLNSINLPLVKRQKISVSSAGINHKSPLPIKSHRHSLPYIQTHTHLCILRTRTPVKTSYICLIIEFWNCLPIQAYNKCFESFTCLHTHVYTQFKWWVRYYFWSSIYSHKYNLWCTSDRTLVVESYHFSILYEVYRRYSFYMVFLTQMKEN